MNQLLRLPLLKYTHTHTHRHTHTHTHTQTHKHTHTQTQGIGAVNCCRKDLHPRRRSYPRFSSFLCKCNLTKT